MADQETDGKIWINIGGKRVQVGQSFKLLSPEEQQQTVNEIAAELGIGAPENPFKSPGQMLQDFGSAFNAATLGSQQGATLNAGDEIYSGLTAPFRATYSALTGNGFDIGKEYADEMKYLAEDRQKTRDQNPGAYDFGHFLGTFGLGGAFNKSGANPVRTAPPTAASFATRMGAAGGAYGATSGFFGSDGDLNQRLIDALNGGLWGAGTGAVLGSVTGSLASRQARSMVPTVKDLKSSATNIYDSIRKSLSPALRVPRQDLATTVNDISAELISRGLKDGGGLTKWVRDMNAMAQRGDLVGSEAMMMRERLTAIIQDKAGKSDAALATIALRKFDPVLEKYIPDLSKANQLWWSAKNGELIERAIGKARAKAGSYTQSGFENALRREFINLDTKIEAGTLVGLSPVEIKVIKEISRGTKLSNLAMWAGKLAPTGPVPWILHALLGAGGYVVGGGPLGSLAATTGATTLGVLGRAAEGAILKDKAGLASVIARNLGQMPVNQPAPLRDALMQGLTYGIASNPRTRELPQSLMELMGVSPVRPTQSQAGSR